MATSLTQLSMPQDSPGPSAPARGASEESPHVAAADEPRPRSAWNFLESLVVFAFGAALMHFAYSGAGSIPVQNIGVPGHDSFYHIKMAAMLGEHGLLREFPWLKFVYFTREGPSFVSHHYGFHILLWPFVTLSNAITGDYLTGGRWATEVFFGLVLVVFNAMLIRAGIPWRPFWIMMFLFIPYQFFTRHAFVRAITPAMLFMLLTLAALHGRRPLMAALSIFGFTHLYLGGVIYGPIIVACFVAAESFGPAGQRRIPWTLLAWSIGGWLVGVLTYPYASGTFEFLKLQIFGSGLTPDISVGQEWYPYENVWWFAQMCGALLGAWMIAVCLRLRFGPTVDSREWSLVLLTLAFLLLNLKARRFIEYWPMFGLLGTAYLSAPLVRRFDNPPEGSGTSPRSGSIAATLMLLVAASLGAFLLLLVALRSERVHEVISWWPVFGGIAAAYFLVWAAGRWFSNAGKHRGLAIARGFGFGSVLFLTGVTLGAPLWHFVRRDSRCQYDLTVVRPLMDFLKQHSRPGDVVFTDDWDVFPLFFYHNTHNHYIVGLDPKFTHERRPDLWERYVRISRGQTPADSTFKQKDASGKVVQKSIHVRLEDIREHFGARFVITDADHRAFASKLVAAPHFARLIYPSTDYSVAKDQPFLLFEIMEKDGNPPIEEVRDAGSENSLYLSSYRPVRSEQGWGDLGLDVSVSGGPLLLNARPFARGLGTHAPAKIEYRIPDGFDFFEAIVGLDSGSESRGSVIASVTLDDKVVFVTPLLTGSSEPVAVKVELGGARRLGLHVDPTGDGNRFDHVDWADARLVRLPGSGKK